MMKLVAASLAMLVSATACGLFTLQEPYERWEVTIAYHDDDGLITVEPSRVEVGGPRGEIRIDNTTRVDRGFQIRDLGISVELDGSGSRRIDVTAAQDGETYEFFDHLNRDGPRGTIVVTYDEQD